MDSETEQRRKRLSDPSLVFLSVDGENDLLDRIKAV